MKVAQFYLWVWERFKCPPHEFDQMDAQVMRWLEIESAVREATEQHHGR